MISDRDQKLSDALARYEADANGNVADVPKLYTLLNAVREWDVARQAANGGNDGDSLPDVRASNKPDDRTPRVSPACGYCGAPTGECRTDCPQSDHAQDWALAVEHLASLVDEYENQEPPEAGGEYDPNWQAKMLAQLLTRVRKQERDDARAQLAEAQRERDEAVRGWRRMIDANNALLSGTNERAEAAEREAQALRNHLHNWAECLARFDHHDPARADRLDKIRREMRAASEARK